MKDLKSAKFELGEVVTTSMIAEHIAEYTEFSKDIMSCLARYCRCDWGDLCDEDIKTNSRALEEQNRLLGAYKTSKGKIYIITECDRSITTILYTYEY